MLRRTALLIRCSTGEATTIRDQARTERRTISSYLLNIVVRSVEIEERIEGMWVTSPAFRKMTAEAFRDLPRPLRPRTAVLVRCSMEEASRIRAAARRKRITISGYVLHCFRRSLSSSRPDALVVTQASEDIP